MEAFLTHLAVRRHVSASTQNRALNALVFLFRDVIRKELGEFDAVRTKRPIRLLTVLSQDEVRRVLASMESQSMHAGIRRHNTEPQPSYVLCPRNSRRLALLASPGDLQLVSCSARMLCALLRG